MHAIVGTYGSVCKVLEALATHRIGQGFTLVVKVLTPGEFHSMTRWIVAKRLVTFCLITFMKFLEHGRNQFLHLAQELLS